MRVFVGTMLGTETGLWCDQQIARLTTEHRDALRGIPQGSAHLTHVFCADLGEVPLDAFIDAVRATATGWPAFTIRFGGLSALPPGPRPRLISLDVPNGAGDLARLSAGLVAGIRRAFPTLPLDPAKSAHVTLARFRKHAGGRDTRAVVRALESLSRTMGERDERIDRVDVVRSTLTESGPVYDPACVVPLAPAETSA